MIHWRGTWRRRLGSLVRRRCVSLERTQNACETRLGGLTYCTYSRYSQSRTSRRHDVCDRGLQPSSPPSQCMMLSSSKDSPMQLQFLNMTYELSFSTFRCSECKYNRLWVLTFHALHGLLSARMRALRDMVCLSGSPMPPQVSTAGPFNHSLVSRIFRYILQ